MSPVPLRVVGVDGGATRTRFLLADGSGRILGRREGGGALLGVGDEEELGNRLVREVRALAGELDEPLPVEVLCAGLAGVAGREEARRRLEAKLVDHEVARRVHLVSDGEIAFFDAFGEGPGILLVAGTGSIAKAKRGPGAELRRVGGWGALLGDEGSGYGIGLAGLRAAIRASEGRGADSALVDVLPEALELDSIRELKSWVDTADKAGIAALGPRVVRTAEAGDRVAEEIVDDAVRALTAHVRALAAGEDPPPRVALVGGLIEPGGSLRSRVRAALQAAGFEPLEREVEPVRGAVQVALRG